MRKSYYVMHKLLRYAKNVLRYAVIITLGAIQVLRNAIFLEIGPPSSPSDFIGTGNNIEHYTFVTLFSRKSDPPTPICVT